MSDVKPQLCDTFGEEIQENGKINRSKLRKIVFTNKQQLLKLNNIVHPKICNEVNHIIKTTTQTLIIIEGALIHQVDWNIFVTTPFASTHQPPQFLSDDLRMPSYYQNNQNPMTI